jgi:hypothetical protein
VPLVLETLVEGMIVMNRMMKRIGAVVIFLAAFGISAGNTFAQGSRKDDVVFNAQGRPMAGAAVRICTSTATGQPCTPLALIYSDPALTQALANPMAADGLGNYTFYAAPGRYEVEISGPGITTKQLPNVILPSDPSTPTFTTVTTTSGISAFSLSLTGNLAVTGSASVAGTLTVGGAPVPSVNADNQWTVAQRFKGPIPWRDFTTYMPAGGCSSTATDLAANTTGTISSGSTALTVAAASDFKNGCGIAVLHAGPTATLNTPPSTITLSSISRSGSTTVTVASSGAHGLLVASGNGYMQGVTVSGCSISAYNGTFPIQTIADATHFTYTAASSGTDAATGCTVNGSFGYAHGATGSTTYHYKIAAVDASMGTSAASATAITITNANSTLTKYNYNHVMWPLVAGAYEFIIYSDLGLGGAYSCVGASFTNAYSDKGQAMPCPVFAPVTPPSSAGAETLNTTIAAGGGTTTLTLAAAAATSAAGQNVYHDETSFLTSCINDVLTYESGPMVNQGNEYGCLIPAGSWWFNAMMPTQLVSTGNKTVRLRVTGKTVFHTLPWFITSQYFVEGEGAGTGASSFQNLPQAGVSLASSLAAGVVIDGNSIEFTGFSVANSTGHGIYVTSGAGITVSNDTATSTGAGAALVLDFQTIGFYADHDVFYGGASSGSLPAIMLTGTPYATTGTGSVFYFDHLVTINHAFEFSNPGGNQAGGGLSAIFITNWLQEGLASADVGLITMDNGPDAPGVALNYLPVSEVAMTNMVNADTTANAEFAASDGLWNLSNVTLINTGIGSGVTPAIGCVNNSPVCNGALQIPEYFATNGPQVPGIMSDLSGAGFEIGTQNHANISRGQLFLEDTLSGYTPANVASGQLFPSPAGLSVTGTGAGSLAAGTWCAQVAGVDARGMETLPSSTVCQSVGASASISYSWGQNGLPTAYTGFSFYYCTIGSGTCAPNARLANVAPAGFDPITYTFTSTTGFTSATPNTVSLAYLSWMAWDEGAAPYSCFYCTSTVRNNSDLWPIGFGMIPTPNVGINIFTQKGIRVNTQYQASEATAPAGVASVDELWADSTAHQWKKIENNGTAFNVAGTLSGTTGSIGGSALTAGQCASGTVAVAGSTTGMTVTVSPNTYPGDGFIPWGYVSAGGTVTVKVCAEASGTPTSSTYNVRVIQ